MATNAFERSFVAVTRHYDGAMIAFGHDLISGHFDLTLEVVYDFESRDLVATVEYLGTGEEARDDVSHRVSRRVKAREGIEYAAFDRLESLMRGAVTRRLGYTNAYILGHLKETLLDASDEVDAYLYSD